MMLKSIKFYTWFHKEVLKIQQDLKNRFTNCQISCINHLGENMTGAKKISWIKDTTDCTFLFVFIRVTSNLLDKIFSVLLTEIYNILLL